MKNPNSKDPTSKYQGLILAFMMLTVVGIALIVSAFIVTVISSDEQIQLIVIAVGGLLLMNSLIGIAVCVGKLKELEENPPSENPSQDFSAIAQPSAVATKTVASQSPHQVPMSNMYVDTVKPTQSIPVLEPEKQSEPEPAKGKASKSKKSKKTAVESQADVDRADFEAWKRQRKQLEMQEMADVQWAEQLRLENQRAAKTLEQMQIEQQLMAEYRAEQERYEYLKSEQMRIEQLRAESQRMEWELQQQQLQLQQQQQALLPPPEPKLTKAQKKKLAKEQQAQMQAEKMQAEAAARQSQLDAEIFAQQQMQLEYAEQLRMENQREAKRLEQLRLEQQVIQEIKAEQEKFEQIKAEQMRLEQLRAESRRMEWELQQQQQALLPPPEPTKAEKKKLAKEQKQQLKNVKAQQGVESKAAAFQAQVDAEILAQQQMQLERADQLKQENDMQHQQAEQLRQENLRMAKQLEQLKLEQQMVEEYKAEQQRMEQLQQEQQRLEQIRAEHQRMQLEIQRQKQELMPPPEVKLTNAEKKKLAKLQKEELSNQKVQDAVTAEIFAQQNMQLEHAEKLRMENQRATQRLEQLKTEQQILEEYKAEQQRMENLKLEQLKLEQIRAEHQRMERALSEQQQEIQDSLPPPTKKLSKAEQKQLAKQQKLAKKNASKAGHTKTAENLQPVEHIPDMSTQNVGNTQSNYANTAATAPVVPNVARASAPSQTGVAQNVASSTPTLDAFENASNFVPVQRTVVVNYIPNQSSSYDFVPMGDKQSLEEKFNEISKMDKMQFVIYIARLLSNKGYSVKLTPVVDNHGIDMLVEKSGVIIAVGCVHSQKIVSEQAVAAVIEGCKYYGTYQAMALTNMFFDIGAVRLAKQQGISLIDRSILIDDFM